MRFGVYLINLHANMISIEVDPQERSMQESEAQKYK